PLASCDEPGELATPTGAAIVVTLSSSFGPLPAMRLEHVGVGAGARVGKTRPNLLRVMLGEQAAGDDAECDSVAVIECQIDDASGEALAFAAQQMLAAGALDAYLVPIIMKKGRPGHLLTVLARPADARRLADEALLQTSTFGVRYVEARRTVLAREHASVETAYGPIRIKVGRRGASVIRAAPEYEDCAAAARRHGKTFAAVWRAAQQAWERTRDDPGAQQ
ncbi:MAG: LarC family nickel insertion protein, partial [Planctomycetota bacterium]